MMATPLLAGGGKELGQQSSAWTTCSKNNDSHAKENVGLERLPYAVLP